MSGSVEERMARAVEAFGKDLGGFRTGRASAALVEHITVDHYGAKTPLNQMAGISVPENTLLVVQPWDPTAIPAIEKALNNAQLGMTPAVDGNIIRLRVPSMTEERRKDLVKQMGKRTEEARIEIRTLAATNKRPSRSSRSQKRLAKMIQGVNLKPCRGRRTRRLQRSTAWRPPRSARFSKVDRA